MLRIQPRVPCRILSHHAAPQLNTRFTRHFGFPPRYAQVATVRSLKLSAPCYFAPPRSARAVSLSVPTRRSVTTIGASGEFSGDARTLAGAETTWYAPGNRKLLRSTT